MRFNPAKLIPQVVLNGASGLTVLTVAKARAILTYKLSIGLMVARWSDRRKGSRGEVGNETGKN
jgi:SH3 domain-containing YSC84-like protein 1